MIEEINRYLENSFKHKGFHYEHVSRNLAGFKGLLFKIHIEKIIFKYKSYKVEYDMNKNTVYDLEEFINEYINLLKIDLNYSYTKALEMSHWYDALTEKEHSEIINFLESNNDDNIDIYNSLQNFKHNIRILFNDRNITLTCKDNTKIKL